MDFRQQAGKYIFKIVNRGFRAKKCVGSVYVLKIGRKVSKSQLVFTLCLLQSLRGLWLSISF